MCAPEKSGASRRFGEHQRARAASGMLFLQTYKKVIIIIIYILCIYLLFIYYYYNNIYLINVENIQ